MKKLTAIIIAVILAFSLAGSAFADGSMAGIVGSYSNVNIELQSYASSSAPETVHSVSISWDNLLLNYTEEQKIGWDPALHEYTTVTPAGWVNGKNSATITIENLSNCDVWSTVKYIDGGLAPATVKIDGATVAAGDNTVAKLGDYSLIAEPVPAKQVAKVSYGTPTSKVTGVLGTFRITLSSTDPT